MSQRVRRLRGYQLSYRGHRLVHTVYIALYFAYTKDYGNTMCARDLLDASICPLKVPSIHIGEAALLEYVDAAMILCCHTLAILEASLGFRS